jgi:hypothetical protein
MAKDFTFRVYFQLLEVLKDAGYLFQTYCFFVKKPYEKSIILRHDVDARKEHSLQFASIQHELGITGTYYFRMVPESFDKEVIKEIASMGHEIGYHYEDMDFANGDVDQAYELAKKHLACLREVADVKTICMHGSPRSVHDNKEVWRKYDYRELGIIAEPYFDLDFSKVLYLTDTGRRWDGDKVSIRDKIPAPDSGASTVNKYQKAAFDGNKAKASDGIILSNKYRFHTTQDIIEACKAGRLPNQIMMNFHPQRWTDNPVLWTRELVLQNLKNLVKRGIIRYRTRSV